MPNPRTVKKHGGVRLIHSRRLSNGTMLRVYAYRDGKAATTEKGKKKRGTHK